MDLISSDCEHISSENFQQNINNLEDVKTKIISLENFDPLNSKAKINSLRSLKICKEAGVPTSKLFHITYEEIKKKAPLLRKNDSQYLKIKYIETETQRQKIVDRLKRLRRTDVDQSNTSTNTIKNSFRTNCSKLNPDIIQYETQKVKNNLTREIMFIIEKAKKDAFTCFHKYQLKSKKPSINLIERIRPNTSQPKRNSAQVSIYDEGKNGKNYLKEIDERHKRNIRMKTEMHKRKHLLSTLKSEQRTEMNETLRRLNERRRQKLIEKINEEDIKIEDLHNKKEELSKLRQEIRKNADLLKYRVRSQIQTSVIRHKVIFVMILGIQNR